jgi:hypothetical protein
MSFSLDYNVLTTPPSIEFRYCVEAVEILYQIARSTKPQTMASTHPTLRHQVIRIYKGMDVMVCNRKFG